MKNILVLLAYPAMLLPFAITFICVFVFSKLKTYTNDKGRNIYAFILSIGFYLGFLFAEVTVPKLNQLMHGVEARVMGWEGFVQDYLIPIVIVFPIFAFATKIKTIQFNSIKQYFIFYIVYYTFNHVAWWFFISIFSVYVY